MSTHPLLFSYNLLREEDKRYSKEKKVYKLVGVGSARWCACDDMDGADFIYGNSWVIYGDLCFIFNTNSHEWSRKLP